MLLRFLDCCDAEGETGAKLAAPTETLYPTDELGQNRVIDPLNFGQPGPGGDWARARVEIDGCARDVDNPVPSTDPYLPP